MTTETKSNLLKDILHLESLDNNIYRSNYTKIENRRGIFGGQIVGQALCAANDTVAEHMVLHSMHSYFILPGDTSMPVMYRVDCIRDGKSFCTRVVYANQNHKHIFTAMVSYHKLEPTTFYFQTKMPDVPHPDTLPFYEDMLKDYLKSSALSDKWKRFIESYLERDLSFQLKLADADWFSLLSHFSRPSSDQQIKLLLWLKLKSPIDEKNVNLGKSVVGYISDSYLLQTAIIGIPHNLYNASFVVSLDHSLWFHQNCDANDWLLYECENMRYCDGRALANGRIWTTDGRLVVTVAQEGLIRLKSKI